jgi:hypothetical protein
MSSWLEFKYKLLGNIVSILDMMEAVFEADLNSIHDVNTAHALS